MLAYFVFPELRTFFFDSSEVQDEETPKPRPSGGAAMRSRSLRERFASKRSYSENFKEPPPAPTSPSKEPRTVRPSLPIIGVPSLPVEDQVYIARLIYYRNWLFNLISDII